MGRGNEPCPLWTLLLPPFQCPLFYSPPKLPPLPPLFTAPHTPYLYFFLPLKVLFIQLRLAAQFFILSPGLTPHSPLTFIQDSINMLSSAKKSGYPVTVFTSIFLSTKRSVSLNLTQPPFFHIVRNLCLLLAPSSSCSSPLLRQHFNHPPSHHGHPDDVDSYSPAYGGAPSSPT